MPGAQVGVISQLTDGWFGEDGESLPEDWAILGGWWISAEITLEQINNRLIRLETLLMANKPIFINSNGNLQELNIGITP